jgi:hypothetical protein
MSQLIFSTLPLPKEKKILSLATMADGFVQNQVYWVMGERASTLTVSTLSRLFSKMLKFSNFFFFFFGFQIFFFCKGR